MYYCTAFLSRKIEQQYAYSFLIILNQLTISEFLHNSFFYFFGQNCCLYRKMAENSALLRDSHFGWIIVHVSYYFVGLHASLETNTLPYGITASQLEAQYFYRFTIILNQSTVSDFSHNSLREFFWLELLYCTKKWLKTPAHFKNECATAGHYCLWNSRLNVRIVYSIILNQLTISKGYKSIAFRPFSTRLLFCTTKYLKIFFSSWNMMQADFRSWNLMYVAFSSRNLM